MEEQKEFQIENNQFKNEVPKLKLQSFDVKKYKKWNSEQHDKISCISQLFLKTHSQSHIISTT